MNKNSWVDTVFKPKYYKELNLMPDRQRGDGFLAMFEALENRDTEYCSILETGCMRPGGELSNDGQSTKLFNEFVQFYYGDLISVDIDQNHTLHASREIDHEFAAIYQGDSVKFMWETLFSIHPSYKADLIYMDAYDVDFVEPWRSNLHHMKELVAASRFIKSGTVVGVDDCFFTENDKRIPEGVNHKMVGKGFFVEQFMNDIGAKKLHDGYQKVWIIT